MSRVKVTNVKSNGKVREYGSFITISKEFIVKSYESIGCPVTFSCHNVTIMKNAQGDRVIIQEVK